LRRRVKPDGKHKNASAFVDAAAIATLATQKRSMLPENALQKCFYAKAARVTFFKFDSPNFATPKK
jgi:hypothetical protein